MAARDWKPTHTDPLFIFAMDQRDSFAKSVFDIDGDATDAQLAQMRDAKSLIFDGLQRARPSLPTGRAGVLVDEQLGQAVIDAAHADGEIILACPIEASGHDWFTLEYGDQWLDHVKRVDPYFAKVLVRDNPAFDAGDREKQLKTLADVSRQLEDAGYPLLYELLVPGTDEQLKSVDGDSARYDRDVRPDLVVQVIHDNQDHGVNPTLWKVEGLDTVDAAQAVANAVRRGGRNADLIVLGRDAPAEQLNQWLGVASQVDEFVGFAIGRSNWKNAIESYERSEQTDDDRDGLTRTIADNYLDFASHWRP